MAAEQRKLLEQLMGSNIMTSSGSQATQFTDAKVCRSYLVGDCPHDMFVATKMDLGLCPKIHSEQLKIDYQQASLTREYGYEYDYQRDLAKYVEDCNRRIEQAQRRLERSPEEIAKSNALTGEIAKLEEAMDLTLQEVEVLGELGHVTRAIDEYYTVEKLRVDKESREQDLTNINSGADDHQKLQVCDVCGAYLSKLDNDRRLADHFGGKLHQGYFRMRTAADANNAVIEKKRALGIAPPQRRDEEDRGHDYGGRDRAYGRQEPYSSAPRQRGRGRGRRY
ncbi:protein of unknown function [Taphrina deformans PYCC 5710]|uniref:U1 snRNP splicing complex subunit n=1 Tax=Taphrina deformans (strain PYCC 5710 / ATCC 11124 / CBS 356.35 / IMI 108563 / JCM 9778 / NBRC 8474) TaxID=1097556 RepID=R4XKR0_TAPDE|nr:protein of unknown function [Taphrina deformans PYCC 5710]|eukprot:CCG83904.1 protein of unknown function [Taphrina deformans PYCC 5710]